MLFAMFKLIFTFNIQMEKCLLLVTKTSIGIGITKNNTVSNARKLKITMGGSEHLWFVSY